MERLTSNNGRLYACGNNLGEDGMSCTECRYREEAERKLAAYEDAEEQENQACNGCKHKGLYEKQSAYGFDCPCYYCKRRKRETDNYETR